MPPIAKGLRFPLPLLGVALAVAILEDSVVEVELGLQRISTEGSGVSKEPVGIRELFNLSMSGRPELLLDARRSRRSSLRRG